MIVPETHDEGVSAGQGLSHLLETALLSVDIWIPEGVFHGPARSCGKGVVLLAHAWDLTVGMRVDLAILYEESLHFLEVTVVGAVSCDELGHDCHLLVGVNGFSGSKEIFNSGSEGIQVAAIFVTCALVSLALVAVTACGSLTSHGTRVAARMACVCT